MKIYRFKNGDLCPCCGQPIAWKTPEELVEFSVTIYGFATALRLADWLLRPGDDAIEIAPDEVHRIAFGEIEE